MKSTKLKIKIKNQKRLILMTVSIKKLPCPDVFMAIDATVCVIQRPIEDGRKYYAGGQT